MAAFLAAAGQLLPPHPHGSSAALGSPIAPSTTPPIETTWKIFETVLDEVGSPRSTLLGIWDGCNHSVLFAATRPERVSIAVLWSSSPAQLPKEGLPVELDEPSGMRGYSGASRDGWGTRSWVVRNARWMGPSMLHRARRARALDLVHAPFASPSLRGVRDAQLEGHRYPRHPAHRPSPDARPASDRRPRSRRSRHEYVAEKIREHGSSSSPATTVSHGSAMPRRSWRDEAFVGEGSQTGVGRERRLGTILFTDIVGSTEQLAAEWGAAWRERLAFSMTVVNRDDRAAWGRVRGIYGRRRASRRSTVLRPPSAAPRR